MPSSNSATQVPQGLRQRLARNVLLLGGGTGLAAVLALGSTAINSRALPIAEFGLLILLQATATLIASLFAFGTQQPVIKLGVDALEKGDRKRFRRIVGMGFLADAISSLCATVAALVLLTLAPRLFGTSADQISIAVIVAASLAFQGYRTAEGVFRALDKFDLLASTQIIGAVVHLTVSGLFWWLDAPFTWYGWLAASAISLPSGLQLLWALFLLRRARLMPMLSGLRAGSKDRDEFIAYCWTTWFSTSLDSIRQSGDAPLIGAVLSIEAVGIYNVAKQLAGVLRKGTMIYASVFFPEIAKLASRRDKAGARRLLIKVVLSSAALTIFLTLLAGIGGGWALGILFRPVFSSGHLTLVLLFAAAGLQLISATYSMFVQAFNGPTGVLHAYVLATALYLLAMIPAMMAWGIAGAGAAQILFSGALAAACALKLRGSREYNPIRETM